MHFIHTAEGGAWPGVLSRTVSRFVRLGCMIDVPRGKWFGIREPVSAIPIGRLGLAFTISVLLSPNLRRQHGYKFHVAIEDDGFLRIRHAVVHHHVLVLELANEFAGLLRPRKVAHIFARTIFT